MRRLLVTGGAGFIGSNFVHLCRAAHPQAEITVLDALTYAGDRRNLEGAGEVHFVEGDIRDTALVRSLLRERGLDCIVNFAAETHVDRSISGPSVFVETNVLGTQSLLEAARAEWLDEGTGRPHRFHQVSTDEVFGSLGPDDAPCTERSLYAPNSPYSASKAGADHMVRAYRETYGLETTTSFCSNNYGPRQYPEKLIPAFLSGILQGRPLPLYGDGLNIRDWLHVSDHCRGIVAILDTGAAGESYNLSGGRALTNRALVEQLCAAVDAAFAGDPALAKRFPQAPGARGAASHELVHFVADRPGHDRRYAIDDTKARETLGYSPKVAFETGLTETVAWYLRRAL